MALKDAISDINKKFGNGTIGKLKDLGDSTIPKKSSGVLGLDIALGGGYPEGKVIELIGWESSGKTTLTLHAIAEEQRKGGEVGFVDAEHAFDREYAKALKVDVEELIVTQPDYGEQALEIVDMLITGGATMIVIDSVAALVPKSEIDGEMGDSKMGLHARLMSQALRKLTGRANKAKCTLIFTNQMREKIGVMFGNPETTTGGNALKFYSSQRVEIKKSGAMEKDKESGDTTALNTKAKIIKNKVAPPFKVAELQIEFGKGVVREHQIVTIAEKIDIIVKSGSWYSYQGNKIGQGEAKAIQFLQDNPEVANEIETMIRKHYNLPI